MFITKDILYAGVNDHQVDLFEGQYTVPNGMAYNSYVILDDKIAVMDTVDRHFQHEWLDNLALILGGRKPDYLVVQHMEPDHSANIASFLSAYPEAAVVANAKTFAMIDQFFGPGLCENKVVVKDGESLSLGKHTLTFVFAPMVHWPEVMVTYDSTDKVLFSADGFGKFGALDVEEEWACEARRYYIGIVGKYGAQVQALLKTADEATVVTILGGMADNIPTLFKGGGYTTFNNQYFYNYQAQLLCRNITGNDLVTSASDYTAPSGDHGNLYAGINLNGASQEVSSAYWTRGYSLITSTNKVMNYLTDELLNENASLTLRKYKGWGQVMRAYAYNYLMESYVDAYTNGGSSKLGLSIYTKYSINNPPVARSSAKETYDSILTWAKDGVKLLKDAQVGYTKDDPTDIDLGVANFVLARAALCAGDWATVISACDEILAAYPTLMNESQYVGVNEAPSGADYVAYFAEHKGFTCLKQNPEVILGYTYNLKAYGAASYWTNNLATPNIASIDTRLYDKIAEGDYRKDNFHKDVWGSYTTPLNKINDGTTYQMGPYMNVKFAANVGIGQTVETASSTSLNIDYCMFRVSEVILMKAEALAQQGGSANAALDPLIQERTNGRYTAATYPYPSDVTSELQKV